MARQKECVARFMNGLPWIYFLQQTCVLIVMIIGNSELATKEISGPKRKKNESYFDTNTNIEDIWGF